MVYYQAPYLMPRPNVLIAEDHAAMRDCVARLVAQDFDVIAAVGDGQAAVDATATLRPDVVVLDISMPVMSGLTAAALLLRTSDPPRVVILTMHDDECFRDAAREVGAHAFVLKVRLGSDLLPAIHGVLALRASA